MSCHTYSCSTPALSHLPDPNSTSDLDMFLPSSPYEHEELHPTPTVGGCSLQDFICYLSQGVRGPDFQMLDHRLKEHRRALMSRTLAQYAVVEHAAHVSYAIDWKEAKEVIAT